MQSLAEWKNESANVHDEKKKKQRVNLEPPRPMAARLIRRFLNDFSCSKDKWQHSYSIFEYASPSSLREMSNSL